MSSSQRSERHENSPGAECDTNASRLPGYIFATMLGYKRCSNVLVDR